VQTLASELESFGEAAEALARGPRPQRHRAVRCGAEDKGPVVELGSQLRAQLDPLLFERGQYPDGDVIERDPAPLVGLGRLDRLAVGVVRDRDGAARQIKI
jgi:hypothetical protein